MIRLPTELTEVVKQGGTVVVPSRQRAHAARLAYAAAELAEGKRVWATPDILPVEAWLTREVELYAATAGAEVPRLLSPAEEWFLWRQCAAEATGELELVNRGALAEALRRASAVAADFGINVRGRCTGTLPEGSGLTGGTGLERPTEEVGLPGGAGLERPIDEPGLTRSAGLERPIDEPGLTRSAGLERPIDEPGLTRSARLERPVDEAGLIRNARLERPADEAGLTRSAGLERPADEAGLTRSAGLERRADEAGLVRTADAARLTGVARDSIDDLSESLLGSLSDSSLEDVAGSEAALLAEVQRAVDERCRSLGAATVASLVDRLRSGGRESRVVCSGFLTIPPRLRSLVSPSRERGGVTPAVPNAIIATDELDELERIAQWCKRLIERNPDARILIALPGAPGTRERLATLIRQAVKPSEWFQNKSSEISSVHGKSKVSPENKRSSGVVPDGATDSLVVIEGGVPLARVPAVAHALATLSWLGGNAGDFEAVSAWLRAPYWQTPGPLLRARLDLWLRERERMHFDLHELVAALSAAPSALSSTARGISAQINKAAVALGQGSASPRDWSERFRAALEAFDWPGERARSSGEQQTVVRFHELLDEFGQLASAARAISRDNAIQWFTELATRTAFRPADDDAVITISSVLAAPVVRYDAIWIAGLHAEAFPQPVQPDPFIPLAAQLAAGVPAASAGGRLAEARALVSSWREGADELVLSAPARSEDLELLPSPLLAEWLAGDGVASRATDGKSGAQGHVAAQSWSGALSHAPAQDPAGPTGSAAAGVPAPNGVSAFGSASAVGSIWLPILIHREGMLETFDDAVGPAWPIAEPLPSGTRSLELQNQCPFRAYAELRLGSTPLDVPEPGIAADLRGQLLHTALQKLWIRLRDSEGLAALSEAALDSAIDRSVEEAADETVRRSSSPKRRVATPNEAQGDLFGDPERSPALSRECRRAKRLIRALCAVERERAPFRVESTELDSTLTLMGAQLRIRIDRVDALESGGRAILDYKSGRRTAADWYGERPSHPQLLAYLAALGEDVVAMATVNVTAREVRFDGIANSAELLPKVKGVEGAFGTDPLDAWPTRRREWLSRVEHLAADFLAGRAVVDPKPGACDYCHVASICRIADRVAATDVDAPVSEAGHE